MRNVRKSENEIGKRKWIYLNVYVQFTNQNFGQLLSWKFRFSGNLYSTPGIVVFIPPFIQGGLYPFRKMFAVFQIDGCNFRNLLS